MSLLAALQVESADEIDFSRPLLVGPYTLGVEAAEEARRILTHQVAVPDVVTSEISRLSPFYWSISHETYGVSELFGVPRGYSEGLPTAVEIALVRALSKLNPEQHAAVFDGGVQIVLGGHDSWKSFVSLLSCVQEPLVGSSVLVNGPSEVAVRLDSEAKLTRTCLSCLSNSFRTSPLKFRFLELYRMMEARFLDDVKRRLLENFDREPSEAVSEAASALKSEMSQMFLLAGSQPEAFEFCHDTLSGFKSTNRFAAALFRRVTSKGVSGKGKHEMGAALTGC